MNEAELLNRAKDGDAEALAEAVKENLGLVKAMALRFRDRGTELEDLIQIGSIGLIKAIRGFDTEYGTQFSTYAVPLIIGEIKKHLRDDGIIKISRETKRKSALVCRERQRLIMQTGAEPRVTELARASGMSDEEVVAALDAASPVYSLSEPVGERSFEEPSSPDGTAAFCESLSLHQALRELPEEEKKLMLLRYYKNLSQAKTAEILGMTQVKVSRREKKIIEKLRELLS